MLYTYVLGSNYSFILRSEEISLQNRSVSKCRKITSDFYVYFVCCIHAVSILILPNVLTCFILGLYIWPVYSREVHRFSTQGLINLYT